MLSASRPAARQGRSGGEVHETGGKVVSVAPKASAEAIRLMKVMESVSSGSKNEEAIAKAKVTEVMEKLASGDAAAEGSEQERSFSEDEVFLALYDHEFDVSRTVDYLRRHRVVGGSAGPSVAADKESSDVDEQGEKWTAVETKKPKSVDNEEAQRTQHRMDNGFGSRQDSRQKRRPGRLGDNRGRAPRRFSGNSGPRPQKWAESGETQERAGETSSWRGEQMSERGPSRGRSSRRFNNQRQGRQASDEGRGSYRRFRPPFRNYSSRQGSESGAETKVTEEGPVDEHQTFASNRRQTGGFSRYRGEQRGGRGGQRFRGQRRNYGSGGREENAFGSPLLDFDFDDLFTSSGDFVNGQVFTRRVFPSRHDHRAPSQQVAPSLSQHHIAAEDPQVRQESSGPSPATGSGSWADLARSPRNTMN